MIDDNFEIIQSMSFCGGELKLSRRKIVTGYYEHLSNHSNNLSRNLQVWFCNGSDQRIVRNLIELSSIIKGLHCKLNDWLKGSEIIFSEIIAPFLNLGSVISSSDLFSFVQEKYCIEISNNLPRIEDGQLLFLCGQFPIEAEATISKVHIDIETLETDVQRIL